MNTEKLLSVAKDLLIDEEIYSYQSIIASLITATEQNDAEQIEAQRSALLEAITDSRSVKFTASELAILKKIGGEKLYGKGAIEHINTFFSYSLFKLKENVTQYRQERKQFIASLNQLVTGLEAAHFTPHYQEHHYEIGIVLPSSFQSLDKTTEALAKWNKFLNTVADIQGLDKKFEVSLVSQGSIELFVLATYPLARAVNLVLDELVKMYEKVKFIRTEEEKLKVLKNERIQSELKTERDQLENNFIESLTTELVKGIKFANIGAKNEASSQLRGGVKTIFKLYKEGVTLEIKPPEIDQEINEELDEKDKTKLNKEIQQKNQEVRIFNETNEKVIAANFKETFGLLPDSDQVKD